MMAVDKHLDLRLRVHDDGSQFYSMLAEIQSGAARNTRLLQLAYAGWLLERGTNPGVQLSMPAQVVESQRVVVQSVAANEGRYEVPTLAEASNGMTTVGSKPAPRLSKVQGKIGGR